MYSSSPSLEELRAALAPVRCAMDLSGGNPLFRFVRIESGELRSFNGALSAASRARFLKGLTAAPLAAALCTAVDALVEGEAVSLKQPSESSLVLSSVNFRALVPCVPAAEAQEAPPAPEALRPIKPGLGAALKRLLPFMGDTGAMGREWQAGVRFEGDWAYATNNLALARLDLRKLLPKAQQGAFTLPAVAVQELAGREEPESMELAEGAASFGFSASWLRSSLIAGSWPKPPAEMFAAFASSKLWKVPPGLAPAVERVTRFSQKEAPLVTLNGDGVVSVYGDEKVELARISGLQRDVLPNGTLRADAFLAVLQEAKEISFGSFPRMLWRGEGIDGLLVGTNG